MSNKAPSTFRKNDAKRAIQAAESAGMKVDRIEIDKAGKISLILSRGAEAADSGNQWDAATT